MFGSKQKLQQRANSFKSGAIAALVGTALFGSTVAPAIAAPVSANAKYVVSLGGNIIAQLNIDFDDSGTNYSIDLSARVSGLGQFVASGSATAKVAGKSTGSSYAGDSFVLNTRTGDGSSDVNVRIAGGNVQAFTIEPPLPPRYDQVPIERSQLVGVNDGLSAFISKSARFDGSICNRNIKVFTGYERFNLAFRFAGEETATSTRTGYQGPVILCQIDYTPVSGHYAASEITTYLAGTDRILIWYAPLGTSDTQIPYRVLVGTAMGDLSMVLTDLTVTE